MNLEKLQAGLDHIKASQMRLDSIVNQLNTEEKEINRNELVSELVNVEIKLQTAVLDFQEAVSEEN